MKKVIKLSILLLILVVVGVLALFYFTPEETLSPDQQEVIQMFGPPNQFTLTYLPRGEKGNELVRTEIWYYPSHDMQVLFLAGDVFSVDPIEENINPLPTSLNPEDYEFFMNYEDVSKTLGTMNIEKIDFLPGMFDEEIQTYMSDKALFTIESDYLTYFQTIGINQDTINDKSEETNKDKQATDEKIDKKNSEDQYDENFYEEFYTEGVNYQDYLDCVAEGECSDIYVLPPKYDENGEEVPYGF